MAIIDFKIPHLKKLPSYQKYITAIRNRVNNAHTTEISIADRDPAYRSKLQGDWIRGKYENGELK